MSKLRIHKKLSQRWGAGKMKRSHLKMARRQARRLAVQEAAAKVAFTASEDAQ